MNNNENKNPQDWKKYWDFSKIEKFVNNWYDSFYNYKDKLEKIKHIPDNINEINTIDLDFSTYEGYTEYMKRLGEVRNKVKDYDEIVKSLSGKTATEIIDDIAKKATKYYLENNNNNKKNNDEGGPVLVTDKTKDTKTNSNTNIKRTVIDNSEVITNDKTPNKSKTYAKLPSEDVSDTEMTRLNRIVNRYFNESMLPWYEQYGELTDDEVDWLHNEILEFACWLKKN